MIEVYGYERVTSRLRLAANPKSFARADPADASTDHPPCRSLGRGA